LKSANAEIDHPLKERHLNEEESIDLIWKVLSASRRAVDPFSDDVSWYPNKRGGKVVVKSDMFVSGTDAPPGMTPEQMSAKAITGSVSDFAAKGVRPLYALTSIALPRANSTHSFILSLAKGMANACKIYGIKILGGDTNESETDVTINCSCFGFARRIVTRRGARAGDLIGVSGEFGLQRAGLDILLKGARAGPGFKRSAINSLMNPRARLSLGLGLAPYISSSTDSSDGLAISLYHLAEASNLNFELSRIPICNGVEEFAAQNGLKAEELALFGGEEYELVFTFNRKYERKLSKMGARIIGRVLSKVPKSSRPSVTFESRTVERRGWIHNA
jgi:thiamine-monophosphate kinase